MEPSGGFVGLGNQKWGGNVDKTELETINMYNHNSYCRNKRGTRVIIREKPPIKSLFQRFIEYMKPSIILGDSMMDVYQLLKVAVLFFIPLLALFNWRNKADKLPDQWEQQLAPLQHKELKTEDEVDAKVLSYFSVIDDLENRRNAAIEGNEYYGRGSASKRKVQDRKTLTSLSNDDAIFKNENPTS